MILWRILDLVDIGTVSQGLLGHVLSGRSVCYVPVSGSHGSVAAVDRLKYPRACCNEMPATARDAGRRAIVTAQNATVEKIVWHHERSCIAKPVTRHTAPWRALTR